MVSFNSISSAISAPKAATKVAGNAVTDAASNVSSSGFMDTLMNTNLVTTGLAGGATGMVANAGYNYATDSSGGYIGAGILGAASGPVASAAWKAGGGKLFHTAKDVKVSKLTGKEDSAFAPKVTEGQILPKNGDLAKGDQEIRNLEARLANMSPSNAQYGTLADELAGRRAGQQFARDSQQMNMLKTESGARNLMTRSEVNLNRLENSPEFQAAQQREGFRNTLDSLNDDNMARLSSAQDRALNAYNKFSSGGGDFSTKRGQAIRDRLSRTVNNLHAAQGDRALAQQGLNSLGGNTEYVQGMDKMLFANRERLQAQVAEARSAWDQHRIKNSPLNMGAA